MRCESQDDCETQGILTNFRTLAAPWSKTETEVGVPVACRPLSLLSSGRALVMFGCKPGSCLLVGLPFVQAHLHTVPFVLQLLAEWVAMQDAQHDNSQALSALAKRLRSQGYPVSVRTALGGGWGGECLRNLRHSFLVCTVKGARLSFTS